jgi:hypothetical protein
MEKNYIKTVSLYGAIVGVILILISVILYFLNFLPVGTMRVLGLFILNVSVLYVCIFYLTKKIRDNIFKGYLSYWNCVKTGVFISLLASLIISLYTLAFTTLLDPGYLEKLLVAQKEWLANFMHSSGMPDDNIDQMLAVIDEKAANINHLSDFFVSVILGVAKGFVISLIASSYIKKEKDIFAQSETNE